MASNAPPPPKGAFRVVKPAQAPPDRKVPLKSAYPLPVPEFSWEFWFNYFYAELPDSRRAQYFFAVSPADGVYRRDAQIGTAEKTQLLREMLALGFDEFPANERLSAEDMFLSMQPTGMIGKGYGLQNQGVRVVFRGDGRKPSEIEAHKGTTPQTRVPGAEFKIARNFDKSWHPWSDTNLANKVYFRKGTLNQDNCLFSAISVSPEFAVATKFPLLDELRATKPNAVGKVLVDITPTASAPGAPTLAGANRGVAAIRQQFAAAKQMTLLCSRTHVYVVKVKKGWNTEKKQNDPFPERAFEHLRWVDHFAFLPAIRIHFADDMNAGHLIVIEDLKWLQEDVILRKFLGDAGATKLKTYLNRLLAEGKPVGGAGGIVYTPPGVSAPFRIDRIRTFTWN